MTQHAGDDSTRAFEAHDVTRIEREENRRVLFISVSTLVLGIAIILLFILAMGAIDGASFGEAFGNRWFYLLFPVVSAFLVTRSARREAKARIDAARAEER